MNRTLDIMLAFIEVITLLVVVFFVMPKFMQLFASMGRELPVFTQFIINFRMSMLSGAIVLIFGLTFLFQIFQEKTKRMIGNMIVFGVFVLFLGAIMLGKYLPVNSMIQ